MTGNRTAALVATKSYPGYWIRGRMSDRPGGHGVSRILAINPFGGTTLEFDDCRTVAQPDTEASFDDAALLTACERGDATGVEGLSRDAIDEDGALLPRPSGKAGRAIHG